MRNWSWHTLHAHLERRVRFLNDVTTSLNTFSLTETAEAPECNEEGDCDYPGHGFRSLVNRSAALASLTAVQTIIAARKMTPEMNPIRKISGVMAVRP
jgi:hypothetical protein